MRTYRSRISPPFLSVPVPKFRSPSPNHSCVSGLPAHRLPCAKQYQGYHRRLLEQRGMQTSSVQHVRGVLMHRALHPGEREVDSAYRPGMSPQLVSLPLSADSPLAVLAACMARESSPICTVRPSSDAGQAGQQHSGCHSRRTSLRAPRPRPRTLSIHIWPTAFADASARRRTQVRMAAKHNGRGRCTDRIPTAVELECALPDAGPGRSRDLRHTVRKPHRRLVDAYWPTKADERQRSRVTLHSAEVEREPQAQRRI